MIKTILFDIGSTILYEEDIYIALFEKERLILNQEGFNISEENFFNTLKICILSRESNLIRSIASRYTEPHKEICEQIIQKTRCYTDELLQKYPRRLINGIDKVIETLSEKYVLALAGNANKEIKNVLRDLGVLNFFSCTDVSDDIKISKPDIKFFQYYLTKLNVLPDETIFIGDRLDNDIIPAKSLGIKTIWFKNGLYSNLEPAAPNEFPDASVENSQDIIKAVRYIDL